MVDQFHNMFHWIDNLTPDTFSYFIHGPLKFTFLQLAIFLEKDEESCWASSAKGLRKAE